VTLANKVGTHGTKLTERLIGGRYELGTPLGEGQGSEVFRAQDTNTGEPCAIKVFPPPRDERAAQQALDEFARLTDLAHPNLVRVRDAGRLRDGRPFVVSEFLPGPTLSDYLGTSPDRFQRLAAAALGLTDAVAYLHSRGLLHGDISPANVRYNAQNQPVLMDLGLARDLDGGPRTGATGTLGFIAPEALVGESAPASDLFSLGATLYHAWTGVAPFGTGIEATRRLWEGPATAPSLLFPGLPPEWDDLLRGLLAFAPEARPSSARELVRLIHNHFPGHPTPIIQMSAPPPAGDPLAGVLVGRGGQQQSLLRVLEQLAEGTTPTTVVTISGPVGSGRRALIARVLREARLAMLSGAWPTIQIDETGFGRLAAATRDTADSPRADDPVVQTQVQRAAIIARLEERARDVPLCLVLDPGADEELLAEAVAGTENAGRLLVVVPVERAGLRTNATDIPLAPLDAEDVRELIRRAGELPSDPVVKRIADHSGGLAAAASLLVRHWLREVRGEAIAALSTGETPDLDRLLDRSFASLTPECREWITVVGMAPSGKRAAEITTLDPRQKAKATQEAQAAGWLTPQLELPTPQHHAGVCRALAADRRLAQLADICVAELPPHDPRRGETHLAVGKRAEAAIAFRAAARSAVEAEQHSEVAHWGLRAVEVDPGIADFDDYLDWTRSLGICGRYAEALYLLSHASPASPARDAQLAERRAWLLGRSGDLVGARRVLEETLGDNVDEESRLRLRGRLARLLISTGHYAEAFLAATPAIRTASWTTASAAHEAAILALAYQGRCDEAKVHLESLQGAAQHDARIPALLGVLYQLTRRPAEAAVAYRLAVERYQQSGDVHGLAIAKSNLACTLAETGRYAEAFDYLPQATRELGRLRVATDLALALFNTGELLLQVSDDHGAQKLLERLRAEAKSAQGGASEGYADYLDADVVRRRSPGHAVGLYGRAREIFETRGYLSMARTAAFARAEALAEAGQTQAALDAWQAASGDTALSAAVAVEETALLARARIALASAPHSEDDARIASQLSQQAESARLQGRLPVAWHSGCLAARIWDRLSDPRASDEGNRATACFEEIKMNTPPQFRAGIDANPDAPRLRGDSGSGIASLLERTTRAEARLRRILRINKRLNSDLRLARVLETVIDTVIELTGAERGFLLLKDNDGELSVRVARNIDQRTLEDPQFTLSRSIAKQAADSGEPIITVDAAGDQRFREALSVSDLHLRSVLAAPLAVKGKVVGTIYVDHRLRKGVFDDEAVATVMDFGEQAAIAIENVRLVAELRRRENQVQALNRRLERQLQEREADLQEARAELKVSREAANLRYDYRQIVGRTPRMMELFHLLDRVTDTSLPVVIEGESGTGKELVARAIHFNGPRRDRPFVSENCAAIPETLLESALFGHVRGAFTGADRESRGLFAIADGGTLFLDEVGEMSPAMQGKLLRVLQNGEFHRVGGERAQKVDVRIVAATNRDLARMVEQGKFRQDLFFRLAVVRFTLPPLRERRDDIPLLVEHLLGKTAGSDGQTKTIEPAALSRLCAYNWPGNVRELENEITRAAAFSSSAISVADLSPHMNPKFDPALAPADGLHLRPRVEHLEMTLVHEAMQRFGGNQTKTAEALGLSRFGLQKKLKRYRIAL
jgi:transcriptional regulator with GAF, ATPase, and Fis domain/Flp pilus assembly protein TadD